jgi:hypothetical protein
MAFDTYTTLLKTIVIGWFIEEISNGDETADLPIFG